MTARNPVTTHVAPGVVIIVVDVDTAVAIADSVDFAVASGGVTTVGRPLGEHDVDEIRSAAAQAAADLDPEQLVMFAGRSSAPALSIVRSDG